MDTEERNRLAKDAVLDVLAEKGPEGAFSINELRQYTREMTKSEVLSFAQVGSYLKNEGYAKWKNEYTKTVTTGSNSRNVKKFRFGTQALRDGGHAIEAERIEAERSSTSGLLELLARHMESRGFIIEPSQLANFYLALKSSPLVVLAGISGTGKSKLPRLFADLTGSRFQLVSVKPQWADNADLMGYTSALRDGKFVEGEIIKSIQAAHGSDEFTLALLDEMNLAAVEHYFSDFLSVVETRRREESGDIVTDPLPLDLPAAPPNEADPYDDLRGMILPSNLRVVGTANMDETTRLFSPKVLDRAFSIEFGDVDLTTFADVSGGNLDADTDFSPLADRLLDTEIAFVHEAYPEAEQFFDRAAELMEEIRQELQPAGISFGYRSRNQVVMYLYHWQNDDLSDILDLNAAFDLCILQKILPKISGTSVPLGDVLERLKNWLEAEHEESSEEEAVGLTGPFLRSAEKVEWMQDRLGSEGATSFWTS